MIFNYKLIFLSLRIVLTNMKNKYVGFHFGKKNQFTTLAAILAIILLGISCRKNEQVPQETVPTSILQEIKNWRNEKIQANSNHLFNTNKSKLRILEPIWEKAGYQSLSNGERMVVIPAPDFTLSNKSFQFTRYFVFKENNNKIVSGNIIEFIAKSDSSITSDQALKSFGNTNIAGYNGAVIIYDINYKYQESRYYKNGVSVSNLTYIQKRVKPHQNLTIQSSTSNRRIASTKILDEDVCEEYYLYEYWYDGYGNRYGETLTYLYTLCESQGGNPPVPPGGGSGAGDDGGEDYATYALSESDLNNAEFYSDGKPAIDPEKYIHCFNDGKTANNYKLTIYVDQPVNNQNDQWTTVMSLNPLTANGQVIILPGGSVDVGHTFIGFTKNNTDGSSVTQYMGFYPSSASTNTKGVIKDNSHHSYDLSYTVTVSSTQFNTALASLINDNANSNYRLSSLNSGGEYNCTDAAKAWAAAAGITTPSAARGYFYNTPGDFGQALRSVSGVNTTPGVTGNGSGPCN